MGYLLLPFQRITDYQGRSRRLEYWLFQVLLFIFVFGMSTLFLLLNPAQLENSDVSSSLESLIFLFFGASAIVGLPLAIRRMHDTGRSGWWLLVNFVPVIGGLVFLVLAFLNSEPGSNAYGPNPKGVDGPESGFDDHGFQPSA